MDGYSYHLATVVIQLNNLTPSIYQGNGRFCLACGQLVNMMGVISKNIDGLFRLSPGLYAACTALSALSTACNRFLIAAHAA